MKTFEKIINQKNVDMTFYVTNVSRKNTYRDIEVRLFDGEEFINITNEVADELQMEVHNQGVRIIGYGMNMCFALANLITEHIREKYNEEICIIDHDFIKRESGMHIDFMQKFAKRKRANKVLGGKA